MYRMLVVDDEKTERECVRFLIEQSGLPLEVSEAGDGWEALMRLKETDGADILFTDVQMPLMDGLELDPNAKETKVLNAIVELLDDLCLSVEELDEQAVDEVQLRGNFSQKQQDIEADSHAAAQHAVGLPHFGQVGLLIIFNP